MTKLHPSDANNKAVDLPIPELAPVIIATFPDNYPFVFSSDCIYNYLIIKYFFSEII